MSPDARSNFLRGSEVQDVTRHTALRKDGTRN